MSLPGNAPATSAGLGAALRLDGRTALVTGAGGGTGRATALALAKAGARVVLVGRTRSTLEETAAEVGESAPASLVSPCDVTDAAAVRALIGALDRLDIVVNNAGSNIPCRFVDVDEADLDDLGQVDILVNNAGVSQRHRLLESTQEDYDLVMDVSMRGAYNMSRAVVPHMRSRRSGAIVCMGSVAAQRGGGVLGGPHYAAAKGAVQTLAKAMARELAPDGIRANAVAPGMVETDLLVGKIDDEGKRKAAENVPLGRLAVPLDIANACLYLASDLSSYVTGVVLDVSGGLHIH